MTRTSPYVLALFLSLLLPAAAGSGASLAGSQTPASAPAPALAGEWHITDRLGRFHTAVIRRQGAGFRIDGEGIHFELKGGGNEYSAEAPIDRATLVEAGVPAELVEEVVRRAVVRCTFSVHSDGATIDYTIHNPLIQFGRNEEGELVILDVVNGGASSGSGVLRRVPPLNRSLGDLHPDFRKKVDRWLKRLKEEKIQLVIGETYRSSERQARLYEKGRTLTGEVWAPAEVVTKALAGRSPHEWGLALDAYPAGGDGKPVYDVQSDAKMLEVMTRAAELADEEGIYWGGNFPGNFVDYPHFQDAGWRKIQARYPSGWQPSRPGASSH
ncbi:MAG: M15 family metallopeptidase [Armatimonadetes bacterium]|nr:M15 family metallopeptidase [Armatimonadota bacterium]